MRDGVDEDGARRRRAREVRGDFSKHIDASQATHGCGRLWRLADPSCCARRPRLEIHAAVARSIGFSTGSSRFADVESATASARRRARLTTLSDVSRCATLLSERSKPTMRMLAARKDTSKPGIRTILKVKQQQASSPPPALLAAPPRRRAWRRHFRPPVGVNNVARAQVRDRVPVQELQVRRVDLVNI